MVVRQTNAEVLVLNEVGARILELVDEGLSHDQLVERLTDEFEAPAADVAQDAESFSCTAGRGGSARTSLS